MSEGSLTGVALVAGDLLSEAFACFYDLSFGFFLNGFLRVSLSA
jgi:hypothetical protein